MDSPVRSPQAHRRFVELDSLRGLAAMTVMLSHYFETWVYGAHVSSRLTWAFLGLLTSNANHAVLFFFVLSGFVLSLPAIEGRPQPYSTFVIRRIFRIYVPYLGALGLAVCGAYWLHSNIGLFVGGGLIPWSRPLDWRLVGQHILFLGNYDSDQLDTPIWSLVYEMRISLIFPAMCAILLRIRSWWLLAVTPLMLCTLPLAAKLLPSNPGWRSVITTVQFAALFVLGIYLARERVKLMERLNRMAWPARILLGVACLSACLFSELLINDMTRAHPAYRYTLLAQWFTVLGAAGFMMLSLQSPVLSRILHWSPIRRLGEMSYSLYLLHFIVMLCCLHAMYGRFHLGAILIFAGIVSIILSRIWYRMVEVPSIRMGRKLSHLTWRTQTQPAVSEAQ